MKVLDQVRLIVYRFHEKGLEILLVNEEDKAWYLPEGAMKDIKAQAEDRVIELEPIEDEKGQLVRAMAVEGDWHDIPSIRALIYTDIDFVKHKIKKIIPELEKGTYFVVKEAFKKVLPKEYKLLKELKDILLDRNLIKNI